MKEDRIWVLLADDEARFRETTAAVLKRRGFEVTAVESGPAAVEMVRRNPDLDVIVLDVKMPGGDGHQALREIKQVRSDAAVLMLTGHGTPDSAATGLEDGAFEYLAKPCSLDVLARKINEASSKRRSLTERELRVKDIMVPLSSFSAIREDRTIADAVETILMSFTRTMTAGGARESVHRSILVLDKRDKVVGIITFTDLLENLLPPDRRLVSEKPKTDEAAVPPSDQNSFGMFTVMARALARKTVREIMSDAPPLVPAEASLMEAISRILNLGVRRLLVTHRNRIIGVLREQDVFFEMANVIRQAQASD